MDTILKPEHTTLLSIEITIADPNEDRTYDINENEYSTSV